MHIKLRKGMRMAGLKVLIFALFVATVSAGKHDIYRGFSAYGVKLTNQSQLKLLNDLGETLNLDEWQHGGVGQSDAIYMVSPDNKAAFFEELEKNNVEYYIHLEDVATALEEHDAEIAKYQQGRNSRMLFENYPRYAEVDAYLERIAAEYPDIVTLVNAGNSFENRPIKYLKISTSNFTDSSKPIYYMDAMIHAREWVTTPVALYSIYRLVENLRAEDQDLLETVDWIIHPIVNPDGYEYTHTDVRLWRRTRSYTPEVSETCWGIDANRNFDVSFNTVGVSSNPCSDTYPGHEAFSEVETRIVRDIIEEHLDRMQLYMNIHSHGNWVLYGFGNNTLPANVAQIHHIGATMGAEMDAVKLPEAGYYRVGNSAMILYATSGSAQDYGQHVGVPFSYTLELPGYGQDFRVPPQYIDHINAETWRGLGTTARLARSYYTARVASGN